MSCSSSISFWVLDFEFCFGCKAASIPALRAIPAIGLNATSPTSKSLPNPASISCSSSISSKYCASTSFSNAGTNGGWCPFKLSHLTFLIHGCPLILPHQILRCSGDTNDFIKSTDCLVNLISSVILK
eukprot:475755_1